MKIYPASNDSESGRGPAWMGVLLVALVCLPIWVHIPASVAVLDSFDAPKRLVWALLVSAIAAVLLLRRAHGARIDAALHAAVLSCLIWIVARSWLDGTRGIENGVVLAWAFPAALLWVGASLPVRPSHLNQVMRWMLLCAGLLALLMVLQFLGYDPLFAETTSRLLYRPSRMIGSIGYHNQAAHVLALCGSAAVVLMSRRGARILMFLALVVVVSMTGSRGALIGLLGSITAAELLLPGKRKAGTRILRGVGALVLAVVAAVAISALVPESRARIQELLHAPQEVPAVASRLWLWQIAYEMFLERPFCGWGGGAYAFQYLDRLGDILPAEKTHRVLQSVVYAREAHNDLIQFAAEFGVAGLLLVGALFAVLFRTFSKRRAEAPRRVAAAGYVMTYMCVSSLVSFSWQAAAVGPLAGLLLGLFVPHRSSAATSCEARGGGRLPMAAAAVIFCLGTTLVLWFGTTVALDWAVPRAIQHGTESQIRIPRMMHRYEALLGASLARRGQHEAALPMLRHAHEGFRDIFILNNLGNVLASGEEWNRAVCFYDRWSRTGIDHETALQNLSTALEHAGDFAGAAAALDRRIVLWRECSLAEIQRLAILYLRDGNPEAGLRALEWYERRYRPDVSSLPAEYDNLKGALWLSHGDPRAAIPFLESAVAKDPQLESARRNLAHATQLQGRGIPAQE